MFTAAPIRMWSKVSDPESLPWEQVEAALLTCEHYWVATATSAGAPSVRPVWGTWMDEQLMLSVGSTTIGQNLEANRQVCVHLESPFEVVIVEGEASYVSDESVLARFCAIYNPKYGWDFTPTTTGAIVVVAPTRILTWTTVPPAKAKTTPFPVTGAIFRPA